MGRVGGDVGSAADRSLALVAKLDVVLFADDGPEAHVEDAPNGDLTSMDVALVGVLTAVAVVGAQPGADSKNDTQCPNQFSGGKFRTQLQRAHGAGTSNKVCCAGPGRNGVGMPSAQSWWPLP